MKKTITFLLITAFFCTKAQDLPTIAANGFAFPINTKFTIKLTAIDSLKFNFSIIEFEQFNKTIDSYNKKDLFNETGMDSTITFYFCTGTYGDTEKERNDNMQILLLMKNYSQIPLKYSSEIQRKKNGKFESTSNIGSFPGAIGTEMWPYMIYMIGLHDFEREIINN